MACVMILSFLCTATPKNEADALLSSSFDLQHTSILSAASAFYLPKYLSPFLPKIDLFPFNTRLPFTALTSLFLLSRSHSPTLILPV